MQTKSAKTIKIKAQPYRRILKRTRVVPRNLTVLFFFESKRFSMSCTREQYKTTAQPRVRANHSVQNTIYNHHVHEVQVNEIFKKCLYSLRIEFT